MSPSEPIKQSQTSFPLINLKDKINFLFKNKIKKKYLTVVEGKLNKRIGKITLPVTKKKISGIEKMVVDPYSKEKAETSYKVIDCKKGLSLLEVYPKTGRKHQIRKHFSIMGNPIIGDQKFGVGKANHFFLHSFCVEFEKY